ncbi:hypothetical protein T03_6211 [Trichinella britovi]|uniref:Uncharacterized protein n=1 Tax=Trichinella britovi TaxID=45882 RepID=A0A0V0Z2D1_TRIBR|nr:hypothetical protein T03_6211 [Trichinella britovi]
MNGQEAPKETSWEWLRSKTVILPHYLLPEPAGGCQGP